MLAVQPETLNRTTPVTAVISRVVKPECEHDFEAWLHNITDACSESPGYMGSDLIRPSADRCEYVTIFRFDTYDHLRRWEDSEVAHYWLERVKPLILRQSGLQLQTGLEYWFRRPNEPRPNVLKRSVVTWIGLTPLVWIVPPFLAPHLDWMPHLAAVAVSNAVTVLMMSYLVMPFLTHVFDRWLFPHHATKH
jgi:antibiotic biosynthesis monooxygenase (ABM) superfamily enzyme